MPRSWGGTLGLVVHAGDRTVSLNDRCLAIPFDLLRA